ncbi:rhomboid family intramembrane serine protease [Flavivirga aquatica]|uniref:Rhomboid family intramembrane serine protease n=1 Tax=Flavivirga aquatica TaxID=1849968 RepID=A0A1E5T7F7_9FLAO|nr:rhomboid family intramembrane serine protease [Flavivirga aquatica]OEK07314.1 rhomboid family intramembrane serine protease [Flavivirga aquatica]
MMRISETVKHLIIINVIMFIGTLAIGQGVLFYDWFAMHFPKNELFKPWQIITHMFMHGGSMHILFNMFALWMFGSPVEQALGTKRFLFIYISAGLGAVALQVGHYYFQYLPMEAEALNLGFTHDQIIEVFKEGKIFTVIGQGFNEIYLASMVGASGCIMGILAAFGMMNPNAELMMLFLPIPIKAKYFIPGIIILDLVSGITGQSFFSPSNTAYMAHVGGALTGFIIMWYWKKTQFNKNRWN